MFDMNPNFNWLRHDLILHVNQWGIMSDHHFETIQVFEMGNFLTQYKSYLHGIFYIHEYTLYKQ